jgi:hypothetical protein
MLHILQQVQVRQIFAGWVLLGDVLLYITGSIESILASALVRKSSNPI